MKQIIPFKKDLLLKTKASEITSISLEHDYKISEDIISGEFHINGDYKMTEGSINKEPFDFVLPFDIALDSRYKEDTIVVDIDNFYYQLVNDDTLQVNIDLYIDGEKEELPKENVEIINEDSDKKEISNIENRKDDYTYEDLIKEAELEEENNIEINNSDNISINEDNKNIDEDVTKNDDVNNNININNNSNNNENKNEHDFNIFENVSDSDTYKTYYVYILKEDDTIDKIIEKYDVTKEELSLYNDIENIKYGDKIIIPSKNE